MHTEFQINVTMNVPKKLKQLQPIQKNGDVVRPQMPPLVNMHELTHTTRCRFHLVKTVK